MQPLYFNLKNIFLLFASSENKFLVGVHGGAIGNFQELLTLILPLGVLVVRAFSHNIVEGLVPLLFSFSTWAVIVFRRNSF